MTTGSENQYVIPEYILNKADQCIAGFGELPASSAAARGKTIENLSKAMTRLFANIFNQERDYISATKNQPANHMVISDEALMKHRSMDELKKKIMEAGYDAAWKLYLEQQDAKSAISVLNILKTNLPDERKALNADIKTMRPKKAKRLRVVFPLLLLAAALIVLALTPFGRNTVYALKMSHVDPYEANSSLSGSKIAAYDMQSGKFTTKYIPDGFLASSDKETRFVLLFNSGKNQVSAKYGDYSKTVSGTGEWLYVMLIDRMSGQVLSDNTFETNAPGVIRYDADSFKATVDERNVKAWLLSMLDMYT